MKFKVEHSFEKRKAESTRIMTKYPERIPIICERHLKTGLCELDKNKYLVPTDLTIGQFMYVIRKRIKNLTHDQALFFFINGQIPANSALISQAYEEYKDVDGFLYVTYSAESTFG